MGVRYHIPMEIFYKLNPAKLLRYQPYMHEWLKQHHAEDTETGWIYGVYVGRAIGSAFPKGRAYPNEPINFYLDNSESDQQFTDVDRFAAFAAVFNKQFENKS